MACPGSGDEGVAEGHAWETPLKFPSSVTRGSQLSSSLGEFWKPVSYSDKSSRACRCWKSLSMEQFCFVSDRKPRRASLSEELGFPQYVFTGMVFDGFASHPDPV